MKNALIYILFIITVSLGLLTYSFARKADTLWSSNNKLTAKLYRLKYSPTYIMPPCEAQARLRDLGYYNGKIDNIWGPNSEKAYCDWSYKCSLEIVER